MTSKPPRSARANALRWALLASAVVGIESLPVPEPAAPRAAAPRAAAPRAAAPKTAAPEPRAAPAPHPTCPAGSLSDDGVCVPVPVALPSLPSSTSHLELMPGRAPEYGSYLTPIAGHPARAADEGHGVLIAAPAGTLVTLISLEHQLGAARRVTLPGPEPRLLTVHRASRHGVTRTYVLSYEGLGFDTDPLGSELPVGTPLGRLSPPPRGGLPALRLEVRQLRRGARVDLSNAPRWLSDAASLSCDPRNVLPIKPAP